MSRKFAGEATLQEQEELERMLRLHPEWRGLIAQYPQHRQPDTEAGRHEAEAAFAAHAVKMQLSGRTDATTLLSAAPEKQSRRPLKTGLILAGSLVLLACGIIYLDKKLEQSLPATAKSEVVTRKGTTTTITLPDGTKVWLNADSKLSYPETFKGKKTREVTLTGEAYFDVSRDSICPFVIHTDKINIQVLGTAFNVKSYPQDETVETALIHGKIAVTFNDRPSERIILKPSEKLVLRKDQAVVLSTLETQQPKVQVNNIRVMPGNLVQETAWMQNQLVFAESNLKDITETLARRFNITFVFEDDAVKQYTYTGIYENETLDEILAALSLSKKFSYKKANNEIRINR